VVEAGGGVVAHERRLQAITLLFQVVEKEAPVLPFSSVLLLFFCCVSFSLCSGLGDVSFQDPTSLVSFFLNPHGPLSFTSHCPSRSIFFLSVRFPLFGSFSSLFFFFISLRLHPPTVGAGVESLFIGPRERGLLIVVHGEQGSAGLAGQWAWLARRGAPDFSSSRLGVSRLLQGTRLAGINEERGRKLPTFPCCTSGGRRKKNSVVQNAPFHLNVAPANFFKSVLNLSFVLLSPHNVIWVLRINSIASLPISVAAPIVGRVFHFNPWF
jgi:hypothetical protein